MLFTVNELSGFGIAARDGDIGSVREVYFDDRRWVIRHLVVATGGWLAGRSVLISPHAIQALDRRGKRLVAALTQQQVEHAPDIDTDKPPSRRQEAALYDYYGYPHWWAGAGLWGAAAYPLAGAELAVPGRHTDGPITREVPAQPQAERDAADAHLRSSAEVIGYGIDAADGSIGAIDDLSFDERSWAIRYVEVDTRHWLPRRHVLVAPEWIERIDWNARKARFAATRREVESSPPYDRIAALSGEQEQRLQRHYGALR